MHKYTTKRVGETDRCNQYKTVPHPPSQPSRYLTPKETPFLPLTLSITCRCCERRSSKSDAVIFSIEDRVETLEKSVAVDEI